jgi:hypothetical protein
MSFYSQKEGTPIPSLFDVFTFGLAFESIKELGGVSIFFLSKKMLN